MKKSCSMIPFLVALLAGVGLSLTAGAAVPPDSRSADALTPHAQAYWKMLTSQAFTPQSDASEKHVEWTFGPNSIVGCVTAPIGSVLVHRLVTPRAQGATWKYLRSYFVDTDPNAHVRLILARYDMLGNFTNIAIVDSVTGANPEVGTALSQLLTSHPPTDTGHGYVLNAYFRSGSGNGDDDLVFMNGFDGSTGELAFCGARPNWEE